MGNGIHRAVFGWFLLASLVLVSSPALLDAAGPIDFDTVQDIGDLVSVEYKSTSFNRRTGQLRTNVIITNTSDEAIQCPLALVVTSISAPGVSLANASGQTPDGNPFVDLSDQLGGDNVLSPGESTTPFTLTFDNPSRRRFNFDTDCFGTLVLGEPDVSIETPDNQSVTSETSVDVSGSVTNAVSIAVNGVEASISGDQFNVMAVPLVEGTNAIVATAQDAAGNTASDSISIRRDTQPPLVVIESPGNGARLIDESVPVQGTVNDIIPGATVNDDDVTVTINGQPAAVMNRTFFLPDFPLEIGTNTIAVQAVDRAGNVSPESSIEVTREPDLVGVRIITTGGNAQRGPINAELPIPLSIRLQREDGNPEVGRPVTFAVNRGDGLLNNPTDNIRSVTMLTDASGNAQIDFTLGSRTGEGFHRVLVTTPGSLTFAEFCATAETSPPDDIAVVMNPPIQSPVDQPLPNPIAAIVTDAGGNPVEAVEVTFQIDAGDGNFNGQSTATILTNQDGIAETIWTLGPDPGQANNEASTTFDGNPGFPAIYIVSGVVSGSVEDTTVSGIVQDSAANPIVGAKAVIRGTDLEAFTGDDGTFVVTDVPPGGHHVVVLGSAADDPPNDIFFPDIEYAIQVNAGVDNPLDQIVVLPFLNMNDALLAGGDEDVTLTMQDVPGFSITVSANSTFVRNPVTGQLVQQPVELSSSQVKLDKVPMPPPQGSTPLVVGTLQPAGVVFNPPARVCYPNATGLAPGDVADIFAFHHDIGQFVNIGPGTVSEDGSQVCSDPGFGLTQSGWHCTIRVPGRDVQCTNCKVTIAGDDTRVVCLNDEVTFSATGNPAGGTYSWSGGTAVGSTTSSTYKARFSTAGTETVTVRYTCTSGGETRTAIDSVDVMVVDDDGTVPTSVASINCLPVGVAPPPTGTGLTVINPPVIDITAYCDSAAQAWRCRVTQADSQINQSVRLHPGPPPAMELTSAIVMAETDCAALNGMIADLSVNSSPGLPLTKWYMLSATQAHEDVHITQYKRDAASPYTTFKNAVEALTVPLKDHTTKSAAKTAIKALAGFTTAKATFDAAELKANNDTAAHMNNQEFLNAANAAVAGRIAEINARKTALGCP